MPLGGRDGRRGCADLETETGLCGVWEEGVCGHGEEEGVAEARGQGEALR